MNVDAFLNSVRAIVTLLFAGATVWGFASNRIGSDAFLGIATVVLLFWFQRGQAKEAADQATQVAVATQAAVTQAVAAQVAAVLPTPPTNGPPTTPGTGGRV